MADNNNLRGHNGDKDNLGRVNGNLNLKSSHQKVQTKTPTVRLQTVQLKIILSILC